MMEIGQPNLALYSIIPFWIIAALLMYFYDQDLSEKEKKLGSEELIRINFAPEEETSTSMGGEKAQPKISAQISPE